MSNNTIPIGEDENYEDTLMGASLTLVVVVVGIISIAVAVMFTVICVRRWKRKRAKKRFTVISPDGGDNSEDEEANKLQEMPMDSISLQQEPESET